MLYSQWRFRGEMPWTAWSRLEECPWPSRGRGVLTAFAIHAAELESTTRDIVEALGDAMAY
jgi:hypothetical protein